MQPDPLDFPVPTDSLGISKLTTNTYIDGNLHGASSVQYDIAYGDNTIQLDIPADDSTIKDNGTTYTYNNSTYDKGTIPSNNTVSVEAGSHELNHYYYSQNGKGSIVYNANGGKFAGVDETTLTIPDLVPGAHDLWADGGSGEVPAGQTDWPTYSDPDGRSVVMIGWTTDSAAQGTVYDKNGTLPEIETQINVAGGTATNVYAVWGYDDNGDGIADATQLIITPEDQTIYTGGEEGSGTNASFPHPIYLVDGEPLKDVTFYVDGSEWNNPASEYPFTVKYYDGENEITDDETYGEYTAKIVPTVDGTITTSDGKTVTFEPGTLRIRYVSNATEASENALTSDAEIYSASNAEAVRDKVEATAAAGVILPADTTICLNGDEDYPYAKLDANAPYQIALLFDDLLPRTGGTSQDYADQLLAHAAEKNHDVAGKESEVKYLDLVDVNNSNAWVSSSEGSDVFWPYPSGTGEDTEFTLLHFKGLHREYGMDGEENLNNQIAASEVEKVTIEQTEEGIWFHVGASGFSPFALVWEEKSEPSWPDWPPVGPGDDDDDNDDGDDNEPPILRIISPM